MKNGNVNEFIQGIWYQDYTVLYKGYCYFFDGSNQKGRAAEFRVQRWRAHTEDHETIVNEKDDDGELVDSSTVFETSCPTIEECVQEFLSAKVFDGKTKSFWEVQDKMEWLD